jgi:hypothetical protein
MSDDGPIYVSIRVGPEGTRVLVNGVDLSRHVRSVQLDAGPGAITDCWLDLVGVTVDIGADVPRSRIQALTPAQDLVREHARSERDLERGLRTYDRPTPAVILAASLGPRTP